MPLKKLAISLLVFDDLVNNKVVGKMHLFHCWISKLLILSGCGDHPPLGNGSFTLSHDHGYWSWATYSCIQNFFVNGSHWNRCNGGPWLYPFPLCQSMYDFKFDNIMLYTRKKHIAIWHNLSNDVCFWLLDFFHLVLRLI